jgi:hypothetical protein
MVDHLYRTFYGVQDQAMETTQFHTFEGTFVKTKVHKFEFEDGPFNKITVDRIPGYGITNLKVSGEFESLEILIGNVKFEKFWNLPGFTCYLQNHIEPCLEHMLMEFKVHHTGPVEVSYDYVKLLNYDKETNYQVLFQQTQLQEVDLNKGLNKIPVYFNHPVTKLKLVQKNRETTLKDPFLVFPEAETMVYFTEANEKIFEPSVNFSRVEKCFLYVESTEDCRIYVIAECKQIMRYMYGMAGVAFSK